MDLFDLVFALRQLLITAEEHNDQETLSRLLTTFGILVEISYTIKNSKMIAAFVDMQDSARNAMMGVAWKAPVPLSN